MSNDFSFSFFLAQMRATKKYPLRSVYPLFRGSAELRRRDENYARKTQPEIPIPEKPQPDSSQFKFFTPHQLKQIFFLFGANFFMGNFYQFNRRLNYFQQISQRLQNTLQSKLLQNNYNQVDFSQRLREFIAFGFTAKSRHRAYARKRYRWYQTRKKNLDYYHLQNLEENFHSQGMENSSLGKKIFKRYISILRAEDRHTKKMAKVQKENCRKRSRTSQRLRLRRRERALTLYKWGAYRANHFYREFQKRWLSQELAVHFSSFSHVTEESFIKYLQKIKNHSGTKELVQKSKDLLASFWLKRKAENSFFKIFNSDQNQYFYREFHTKVYPQVTISDLFNGTRTTPIMQPTTLFRIPPHSQLFSTSSGSNTEEPT